YTTLFRSIGLERQIMRHPAHGEGIEGRALVRRRSGDARQRSKKGQHGSCKQEIATTQAQSSIGCREEPRSTVWVVCWDARTAGLPGLGCMRHNVRGALRFHASAIMAGRGCTPRN